MKILFLHVLLMLGPLTYGLQESTHQGAEGTTEEKVFYSSRPSTKDLPGTNQPVTRADYDAFMYGLHTAALIAGFYHDHFNVGLARDAEITYDILEIMKDLKPDEFENLHITLASVSRNTFTHDHLGDYIHDAVIKPTQGRPILFFDTGWQGTLMDPLQKIVTEKYGQRMRTQFAVSNNFRIPGQRTAATQANPDVYEQDSGANHQFTSDAIERYVPKYFGATEGYELNDGVWDAYTTTKRRANDGRVYEDEALDFNKKLKQFVSSLAAQEFFITTVSYWRKARKLADTGDIHQLGSWLRYLYLEIDTNFSKGFVYDVIEILRINFSETWGELSAFDLGLPDMGNTSRTRWGFEKEEAKKRYDSLMENLSVTTASCLSGDSSACSLMAKVFSQTNADFKSKKFFQFILTEIPRADAQVLIHKFMITSSADFKTNYIYEYLIYLDELDERDLNTLADLIKFGESKLFIGLFNHVFPKIKEFKVLKKIFIFILPELKFKGTDNSIIIKKFATQLAELNDEELLDLAQVIYFLDQRVVGRSTLAPLINRISQSETLTKKYSSLLVPSAERLDRFQDFNTYDVQASLKELQKHSLEPYEQSCKLILGF